MLSLLSICGLLSPLQCTLYPDSHLLQWTIHTHNIVTLIQPMTLQTLIYSPKIGKTAIGHILRFKTER